MASYQTAANILVALRRETTTGTAAGATASQASVLRIIDSPGLELKRAAVTSGEKRDDGFTAMGRLGGKAVDGSYNAELTVGGATDILFEALLRSTWATATTIAFSDCTNITCGTGTVSRAGGDWATDGIRVGDIFYLTGYNASANNGVNLRAVAVSSLDITVATGALTASSADTAGTLTRISKLVAATTPTRYSHTVEQYDQDVDLSELFLGCRVVGARLSFKPGAMATVSYTLMGMDRTALATGTSPYFATPVTTTSLALLADDSSILFNGATVATFTGFDLDFAINARGEPVIGSLVTADVFDNDCAITGTITGLRSDFSKLTLFDAETEFAVSIRLQEPTGTPPACFALFLPRVKISGLSAPIGGGDGAKVETLTLMVGPKATATGYDATPVMICSSATH